MCWGPAQDRIGVNLLNRSMRASASLFGELVLSELFAYLHLEPVNFRLRSNEGVTLLEHVRLQ